MEKNVGCKNGMWKGDNVGYYALHIWINKHKPKPGLCEECKQKPPYDCANISGQYKRDVNDFKWLCRSCHMKSDNRLEILRQANIGSKHSAEHIEKVRAYHLGKIRSKETRKNISLKTKGLKKTKEHIENLRLSHLGKKPSLETLEKMRLSQQKRRELEQRLSI